MIKVEFDVSLGFDIRWFSGESFSSVNKRNSKGIYIFGLKVY